MPTTPERLRALEIRLDALSQLVSGGSEVEWSQSVRGKLHSMQSAMASADKVLAAAEAVSRAQRDAVHTAETLRGRRLSRTAQWILVVCAVVTAACAVIAAAASLAG